MDSPLVSVIVPIYNVEKYVRKCLDSLKNQTMKQIEVICIDDGSTDESGKIAEEYKSEDWPRFRIIHTENKGLSAARNQGIDEARVDWIMFIDSDDWVEPEFCRIPYEAAIRENADLVIFQADSWKREKRWKKQKKKETLVGLVDEFTAHEYGGVTAWNKLYKKMLFKTIRYPEGHVYEDIATTHKIVHESRRTLILRECLYHKVYRDNSISQIYLPEYCRDNVCSSFQRYSDLVSYGYEYCNLHGLWKAQV